MFVSSSTVAAAIVIFYFAATTTALTKSVDFSTWAPRPPTPQFQSWYPKYNNELINATLTTCNASYFNYLEAYYAPTRSLNASYLLSRCYRLEACLLDSLTSDVQANFNGAVVILGLMPTLLASIGPSVAEISLLSAHRPLLSFLISMGAPAIWPTRIFEYIHPTETLRERRGALRTSQMRPWPAAMTSLVQYIVAISAMVNIITTSIGLGRKSILAWGCTFTYAPVIYSILSSVIHLLSAVSYLIARKMAQRRSRVEQLLAEVDNSETRANGEQAARERMQAATSNTSQHRHKLSCSRSWLRDAFLSETIICANRPKPRYPVDMDTAIVPRVAVLLAVTAGGMGFVHLTFGIIIFSSLQLISVWDVLNNILWRYVVSSTGCRLLLIMEISGLRTNAETGLMSIDLQQISHVQ